MNILFIITARGGSKGIPHKNIKKLGKYPLIAYKIIAAQKSKYNKRIIVSTDDREIAKVGMDYGAEVPFIRPNALASDTADSMDVVMHAMEWVAENDLKNYEYVCLLEPSSPFLSYIDLESAIDQMIDKDSDTMVGVKEVTVSSAFIHTLDKNGGLSNFYRTVKEMKSVRRQDQEKEYTLNGCIYAAKWKYFMENRLFHSINSLPYIMPEEKSIEIDSWIDYCFAKCMIDNNLIDVTLWDRGRR